MKYRSSLSGILIVALAIAALIPLIRTAVDWYQVARVLDDNSLVANARSYDWVVWSEQDGPIMAKHVFPSGPAAEAGVQKGDVFFALDGLQLFNAADLRQAIEGVQPGSSLRYTLLRDETPTEAVVSVSRYPTFLYPTTERLWRFSIWGFALGAFVHLIGLTAAGPLIKKSKPALFSFALILVSALWIVGNLFRLLSIEFLGPPQPDSTYSVVFQSITSLALIGWIVFPALLVRKVVGRAPSSWPTAAIPGYYIILYLPTGILGGLALFAIATGGIGPISLDSLVSPILFYASVYIALAASLMLLHLSDRPQSTDSFQARSEWHITGSAITLVFAVMAALVILGVLPLLAQGDSGLTGWFVVCAQLLSIAPVALVSHATLKYGNIDYLIYRAVSYVIAFGLIFVSFVGGMGLIERVFGPLDNSRNVVAGILIIVLLALFERGYRIYGDRIRSFLGTERRRSADLMAQFQESARTLANKDSFVRESIELVAKAFGARSAIMSLLDQSTGNWILSTYHPEPPYITENLIRKLFPHFAEEGKVWCANSELDESTLDDFLRVELNHYRASVVVPIHGSDSVIGMIILGDKERNRAVYNLSDLDRLRWVASQLALAIDRLQLLDRQKELVRETAQAQMVALRAQINPHFLFNALNTVIALIGEQPKQAESVVENLATIFRHTLNTEADSFVSLESEIELVKNYMQIEKARFGDKLSFRVDIAEGIDQYLVPAFVVQTLVENAVKHGLEKTLDGGTVQIVAAREESDEGISISVMDDGIGIPQLGTPDFNNSETSFFGIGLRNISSRMEQLYGRTDLLRIRRRANGGTQATISVPNAAELPNK